ncbi:hypothetical protein BB561_002717 [Smittium simulii]|uniref:U three protein 7 n=1 Tax=Smittium simulii TaxID=133385 RepID=A0A2T9YPE8_9FUNG|nr:hypothetical protein BB561_002717 [Smittium simulii]
MESSTSKTLQINLDKVKSYDMTKKKNLRPKKFKKTPAVANAVEEKSEYEKQLESKMLKYQRNENLSTKNVKSKNERSLVNKNIEISQMLAKKAARAEILKTEQTGFDLTLKDFGPYSINYSRNGKSGAEVHCLRKMIETQAMDFLPFHYLLTSIGNQGILRYQDTSTGQIVAEYKTHFGPCKALATSEYNSIQHLGHTNGNVTLWSPNSSEPLVKMLCHKGPVNSIAIDKSGTYMATSGLDGQMRIWDIRKYQVLHSYHTFTPATSLDISQLGMLAVGHGPHATLWKDAIKTKAQSPYLSHLISGSDITAVSFVPYEDILGIGHSTGISSIIVPGSGEPNFDTYEANPFETKKQRSEKEIHSLLDKLQPEMITLDPSLIGVLADQKTPAQILAEKKEVLTIALKSKTDIKNKKRGKNSAAKRMLRKKQKNVIDATKLSTLIKKVYVDKQTLIKKVYVDKQTLIKKVYVDKQTLIKKVYVDKQTLIKKVYVDKQTLIKKVYVDKQTLIKKVYVDKQTLIKKVYVDKQTLIKKVYVDKQILTKHILIKLD